ncbi:MAG: DNA mismatch repair protein MutS [Hyphomicrobiaceae bacterium]|nr:DNA mismatch repair protein MutS [Hyphomicrobiaceae bacterium]
MPAPTPEATPSMAQFLEIKAANPDSILWYRMGDFYELFFSDAVVASEALGIVLTKRGKHLGQDIPMCGVPVVRADEYLQRLIRQGYRVAVCEQLEDPADARKRGHKAVVRRDVVRLVTPGTLTEDSLLEAGARNYLTAIFPAPAPASAPIDGEAPLAKVRREVALASLDISTGDFEIGSVLLADLPGELVRLSPREVLATDTARADSAVSHALALLGAAVTPVPPAHFDSTSGERSLLDWLGVLSLGGLGDFSRPELAAAGALLKYVELTQIGRRPSLRPPRRRSLGDILLVDAATRASLELVRSTTGERRGSLLAAIDRTVTAAGARELAARLASPLTDLAGITARLDAVAFLVADLALRQDVRASLKRVPDIARAVSRLSLQRGGPRDLGAIRDGLAAAQDCAVLLNGASGAIGLPAELAGIAAQLASVPGDLAGVLRDALADELPVLRRDGGFIRAGYSADLDATRRLRESSRQVMAELEARYQEATGVRTLKIRHNNILGYFIEVGQASAAPLQGGAHAGLFRHRQTMASAMRFVTDELVETEGKIASAAERALSREQDIFADLSARVGAADQGLGLVAAALADLDVAAALAELAEQEGYTRPHLDTSTAMVIRGGRHPVVEQALKAARAGPFIANDCVLGRLEAGVGPGPASPSLPPGFAGHQGARIWLVTGPNMAGKSTFLRQNALIAVLAQMGSFVPAQEARIGILDRLFSRVGAADDLARGRSTFMVEMVETAGILNQATERSLVILDEIGRGTATYDGLSIAWAAVEFLAQVCRCRTLFATHYHELTALAGRFEDVANVTVEVKEWRDEIVFLHTLKPGAADRSYGIQVAKLAGLPGPVIARASEVLRLLEAKATKGGGAQPEAWLDDLPLFAAARPVNPLAKATGPSPLERALDDLNPDELTPKAALEALYRLKSLRTNE